MVTMSRVSRRAKERGGLPDGQEKRAGQGELGSFTAAGATIPTKAARVEGQSAAVAQSAPWLDYGSGSRGAGAICADFVPLVGQIPPARTVRGVGGGASRGEKTLAFECWPVPAVAKATAARGVCRFIRSSTFCGRAVWSALQLHGHRLSDASEAEGKAQNRTTQGQRADSLSAADYQTKRRVMV